MPLLKNRPLAIACILFALVSFVCYSLDLRVCTYLGAVFLLLCTVCAVLYFRLRRRGLFLAFLCLLMACLSALSSVLFFHSRYRMHAELIGQTVTLEGIVLSVDDSWEGTEQIELSLLTLNGDSCFDTVLLTSAFSIELTSGDVIRVHARSEAFDDEEEESQEERNRALQNGVFGKVVLTEKTGVTHIEDERFSLRALMLRNRCNLVARLEELIGGEEGALSAAFLLGDRSSLSSDTSIPTS